MVRVFNYTAERKPAWDDFVARSKNGVFLFRRDYMEYHADRFTDFSLMFADEADRLVAVMPASIKEDVVASHAGLTFGGIVTDTAMKAAHMLELFDALTAHLRHHGVRQVIYKAVPHIYHRLPAEEDLYALFRQGARLFRRDIATTIEMGERLHFSKGRKWSIKQARKAGLRVERSHDFRAFMAMEEALLASKYDVRPTHTGAELELLASRFPEEIKLFTAGNSGEMLAGIVVYEYGRVAHAQYISASDEGKRTGALDLILDHLINDYYAGTRYFDFGISTEEGGRYLNAGLIENKQSFGGRAVVHDFYEWDLGSD
ncbi:MAG: GNAT family N-acetyltransferase [Pyrinomonadaceae bacterium]